MGDTASNGAGLHIAECRTAESLAAASGLFNEYRHHYGQSSAADARTFGWLSTMVESGVLRVYAASMEPLSPAQPRPIGLATSHPMPASLVMGQSWQVRDLYVRPEVRRQGVAAALVDAVRVAALAAGATRLSLVTERDNQGALGLYRRLGFMPVEGLTSLSLNLS